MTHVLYHNDRNPLNSLKKQDVTVNLFTHQFFRFFSSYLSTVPSLGSLTDFSHWDKGGHNIPVLITFSNVSFTQLTAYAEDLMVEVARRGCKSKRATKRKRKKAPPSLASKFEYPTKEELIATHCSRFNLN